jgi:hypothetical protein
MPPDGALENEKLTGDDGALSRRLHELLGTQSWLLAEHTVINLPPNTLVEQSGDKMFNLRDFCLKVDESAAADVRLSAMDHQGRRQSLTEGQRQELYETGDLSVPSVLFQKQAHVWRLARWFYSGFHTVRKQWKLRMGFALDHLLVGMRHAFVGAERSWWRQPSLLGSAKEVGKTIRMLGSTIRPWIWGLPTISKYSASGIDQILATAEDGYIRSELMQREIPLQHVVFRQVEQSTQNAIWDALDEDADWGRDIRPSLASSQADADFRQQLRQERVQFYKQQHAKQIPFKLPVKARLSPLEARRQSRLSWKMYQDQEERQWADCLEASSSPDRLAEVERLAALQTEKMMQDEDDKEIKDYMDQVEVDLKKKFIVCSLSPRWVAQQLQRAKDEKNSQLEETRLDRTIARLDTEKLSHSMTVAQLRRWFQTRIRPGLQERLQTIQSSFPEAVFPILQLRRQNGQESRFRKVHLSLENPWWRWQYYWLLLRQSTTLLIGNALSFLLSGPLSLRALFSKDPYYVANTEKSTLTLTLASRLSGYYAALQRSWQDFESAPDSGLLGKGIQRPFVRLFLGAKSMFGTILICGVMIFGTTVMSLASLVTCFLAPLFAVVITLATFLCQLTVCDFAVARAHEQLRKGSSSHVLLRYFPHKNHWSPAVLAAFVAPLRLVVAGAGQLLLATLRVCMWHPLAILAHGSLATIILLLRSVRNALTWTLVRRHAQVPLVNSFLAFRISGPGMAATHYTRLPLSAAKTAFVHKLSAIRIQAHTKLRKTQLEAPYRQYRSLIQSLVSPHGVSVNLIEPEPSVLASQWASKTLKKLRMLKIRPGFDQKEGYHDIWSNLAHDMRRAQIVSDTGPPTAYSLVPKSERQIPADLDDLIVQSFREQYEEGQSNKSHSGLRDLVERSAFTLGVLNLQSGLRGTWIAPPLYPSYSQSVSHL